MSYEEKYLGYKVSSLYGQADTGFFGSQDTKQKPKSKMHMGNYEDEEEGVAASAKPAATAKRVSLLIDDDDDDDDEQNRRQKKKAAAAAAPVEDGMFKDMEVTLPINRGQGSTMKVPLRAQQACEELLLQSKNKDISLTRETRQELDKLTQYPDEYTIIDPVVTITATVETGTCRIHLKEVVPVSILLLARVLGVTYFVQVTPKAKTPPTSYEEVPAKPFRDSRSAENNQPFGTEKAVNDQINNLQDMQPDEFVSQIKAYMFSLGPTSTLEASSMTFIETHTDAFKKILSGELVPLTKKTSIRERLQLNKGKLQEDDD